VPRPRDKNKHKLKRWQERKVKRLETGDSVKNAVRGQYFVREKRVKKLVDSLKNVGAGEEREFFVEGRAGSVSSLSEDRLEGGGRNPLRDKKRSEFLGTG